MLRFKYLLLFLAPFLAACSSDEEAARYVTSLTVASERMVVADFSVGRHPTPALLVRESGKKEWSWVLHIEGFSYERGYEYVLEVEVHRMTDMDAPDREYRLVRLVGKTAKQSDGLPPENTWWKEPEE